MSVSSVDCSGKGERRAGSLLQEGKEAVTFKDLVGPSGKSTGALTFGRPKNIIQAGSSAG